MLKIGKTAIKYKDKIRTNKVCKYCKIVWDKTG